MNTAIKGLLTVLLSLVVVVTACFCFCLSICAVGGDGSTAGNRGMYVLIDLIDIAIMVGAVMLITRLNRQA